MADSAAECASSDADGRPGKARLRMRTLLECAARSSPLERALLNSSVASARSGQRQDKGSQECPMAEATLGPLTMLVLYAFAALIIGGLVLYLALASRQKK